MRTCNHCVYESIRKNTRKDYRLVEARPGKRGFEVDIYQIPNRMTDEDWSRVKTGLKPNYHIASFAQLPDHCCC